MTQKQIDEARRVSPHEVYGELDCREMINSCLTYGGIRGFWMKFMSSGKERSYADPYIKNLGIKRVRELVAEQEADFAKAKVLRNVFTDSEGVAYNSVQWADDAV